MTEIDRERSLQAWGREMRATFPEWLGSGTMQEVMAECKTPQQKARLILRQAGSDLDHEWYDAPEFQAFVAEIRRIADTPKGETAALIPNDIYAPAINLTRALSSEPKTVRHFGEEAANGSHIVSAEMGSFITTVLKAGLAETSASRPPRPASRIKQDLGQN